jgi:hypothetical protein
VHGCQEIHRPNFAETELHQERNDKQEGESEALDTKTSIKRKAEAAAPDPYTDHHH